MDVIKVLNNTSHIEKSYKKSNIDAKRADSNIFYCIKCNYCWEYESKRVKKQNKYFTYKYFPTYKKERVLCPKHHE